MTDFRKLHEQEGVVCKNCDLWCVGRSRMFCEETGWTNPDGYCDTFRPKSQQSCNPDAKSPVSLDTGEGK